MRISTAYHFSLLTDDINTAQQSYVTLQNQLSTGKAINQVSDNVYTASLALSQTAVQSQLTQYSSNLNYANTFLGFTDNALGSATNVINSATSIAQRAANSTVDQSSRNAMISQVNQLESQLVSIANTQGSTGEYIFGGQVTQKQPFTVTGTTLTYNGDNNGINVETGPNSSMQINTPGSPVFTTLYSQLETLKTDLANGNVSALSNTDVANLQASASTVLQLRGNVGASVQAITSEQSMNTRRATELTTQLSNETDIDYAATVVKYSEAQSVYQSALSVAGTAFKLNLTSFLP
jgi:flagellar hook-associated protein 3 FlgL